jgi:hypothetical protein
VTVGLKALSSSSQDGGGEGELGHSDVICTVLWSWTFGPTTKGVDEDFKTSFKAWMVWSGESDTGIDMIAVTGIFGKLVAVLGSNELVKRQN